MNSDAIAPAASPTEPPVLLAESSKRSPRCFSMYKVKDTVGDLMLAHSKNDTNPLSYVHAMSWQRFHSPTQPQIKLHATSDPSSYVIATARVPPPDFAKPYFIELQIVRETLPTYSPQPPTNPVAGLKSPKNVSMTMTYGFKHKRQFEYKFLNTGNWETFIWKDSAGPDVQSLGGNGKQFGTGKGMKLVRAATNQVIAAWVHPSGGPILGSSSKKGRFSFIGDRYDDEFELLVVISLIALVDLDASPFF